MDGNEKLVNWNLYVHGCTDGFSRRIIYLRLATTKKAETVLDIFTQGVDKNGLPMRVRGDWGTENAEVINFMESRRSNIDSPFIQGRSVHNTRIERLWAEVNLIVTSKFRQIFYYLEDNNFLHQSSVLDLLCLIYVYFFRIQQSLNNFTNSWNNHGLRTERYASPNELWLTSLLQLHSERDLFSLEMLPESLDLNETVAPTNFQMTLPSIDISVFGLNQEDIDYFCEVADQLVPDPLLDDNQEGVSLYLLLRNHFLNE